MLLPIVFTAACLACVALLVMADRRDHAGGRVFFKLAASTNFVFIALSLGALLSSYGQWLVAALVLGWVGDALLLAKSDQAFLGGLVAFLLSHLFFAMAFASGELSVVAIAVSSMVSLALGAIVLRWLLPHVETSFKGPVLLYIAVILSMCVVATGHTFSTGHWLVLLGALLFAASDLAVARERFVKPGLINRLWGWPTYFVAQIVLAWTVAHHS